jgi:LPXTG-motif cell wall-anchored protein
MHFSKKAVSAMFTGAMALAAVGVAAPAASAATSCPNPQATDFPKAGGGIDLDAYSAAVAAANECKAGVSGSTVAFTGSSSQELAIVGAALVAGGAGAIVIARRRRTSTVDARD